MAAHLVTGVHIQRWILFSVALELDMQKKNASLFSSVKICGELRTSNAICKTKSLF